MGGLASGSSRLVVSSRQGVTGGRLTPLLLFAHILLLPEHLLLEPFHAGQDAVEEVRHFTVCQFRALAALRLVTGVGGVGHRAE